MSLLLQHINWYDPKSHVTLHFTVHEATYLPSWGIYHTATDAERTALVKTCLLLEKIRDVLALPLTVHCMIRPNRVECPTSPHHHGDYNAAIGSTARRSAHIFGLACDFSVKGMTADQVRAALIPRMEEWRFCMEDLPGSGWVHVDTCEPPVHGGRRYFKP
jgi:hypothetical protein